MGENSSFASNIRKFLQKYWQEITIIFAVVVLAASLVAYLNKRRQKKSESGES